MIQVLLLIVILVLNVFLYTRTKDCRLPLPPGPIRWPILGSIPQMMMENLSYPHLQMLGLTKKYGGIVSIGFGVHYAVIVSNYELIKDIFKRTETNLLKFRVAFLEELRHDYKNNGIVFSYGDNWKENRKHTIQLLRHFGFGKKHTMDETIQAEVNELMGDIKKEIDSSAGIWVVDANRLAASAINILWASVGGYRFNPHSLEIRKQLQFSVEIFEALGPKNLLSPFPFLKIFPEISGYKRIGDLFEGSRQFMKELVEDAKQRRQGRVEPHSYVEAYLDEIERNKEHPNPNATEENLLIILNDLFLAGSDTSSSALNWILLYVGRDAEIQNKARAEINHFLQGQGYDCLPSTALASLPYIHAIILEGLRISPFVPTALPRSVTDDIECGGYRIPKGTCLFPFYYPGFHDEVFWGDPEVFRPERLLLADGSLNPEKVERIIQFGNGARICPGENLAMITIFMTLTELLRIFSFEIVPGREPEATPDKPSLTMKPKPFSLRVKTIGQIS